MKKLKYFIATIAGILLTLQVGMAQSLSLYGGGPMGPGQQRFMLESEVGDDFYVNPYHDNFYTPRLLFVAVLPPNNEPFNFAYIVEDVSDKVVRVFDTYPGEITFFQSTGELLDLGVDFYITLSDTQIGVGDPIGVTEMESQRFSLVDYQVNPNVIPEPSVYGLMAGLGLVGFIGYRRFRK